MKPKSAAALLPISIINPGAPGLMPLEGDLVGKYLVIDPINLKERLRFARNQIFKVSGGFGCNASASGSAVFGAHLDGEEARWERYDFIGIASDELVERAKLDKSEEKPLDKSLRVYMAVGPGYFGKADSIVGALKRLGEAMGRRRAPKLGDKGIGVYRVHPEAYINDFCQIVNPAGPIEEIK